jgi:hypothetical protein
MSVVIYKLRRSLLAQSKSSLRTTILSVACVYQTADHQGRQHDSYTLIVGDDHSPAARWQVNVVYSRHGIFVPISRPHRKWNERCQCQPPADIFNHDATILPQCCGVSKQPATASGTCIFITEPAQQTTWDDDA